MTNKKVVIFLFDRNFFSTQENKILIFLKQIRLQYNCRVDNTMRKNEDKNFV